MYVRVHTVYVTCSVYRANKSLIFLENLQKKCLALVTNQGSRLRDTGFITRVRCIAETIPPPPPLHPPLHPWQSASNCALVLRPVVSAAIMETASGLQQARYTE